MKRKSLMLIFVCALFFGLCSPIHAEDKTTISVAFTPLKGFFEYDDNGDMCGYGIDYLNELSKYANIEWKYVVVNQWEDIGPLVRSGKIDVMLPVSEPDTPSKYYDYAVEPIMTTYHAIMCKKTRKDLYYQDYDYFSSLKIAGTSGLVSNKSLKDYLESINVYDHIVFYDDYDTCKKALDSGKVDALISNVMDLTDDMKIIDKFSVVDNYITTLKGNPCYKIINKALTQMKLENPSFQNELYETYYYDRSVEPFTKEESKFIQEHSSLDVAVYDDRRPVSYKDEEGFHGIAIDIGNIISNNIGIKFNYVPVTTSIQTEMLETADLVMPVPKNMASDDYFVTTNLLNTEVLMVINNGEDAPQEGETIGVLSSMPGIYNTMDNLHLFKIKRYETNQEALEAVKNKEIVAFANSSYVINWLLENPRYARLTALRYESFPLSYDICGRNEDIILKSILNKGIHAITSNEKDRIIQKDTKFSLEDLTFTDKLVIYQDTILSVVICLLAIIVGFLLHSHSKNRYIKRIEESNIQKDQANATKSQFLARMSHDMRTPLNVIIGMIHIAKKQKNPPETIDALSKMQVSSEFLLGLINDVLDMEHIESGKIELHLAPYSGKEFSDYIKAVIEPLCEQKSIHFKYTCEGLSDFVVLQDKLHINQIYFNLLSNAVKFTPKEGTVDMHSKIERLNEHQIEITATISDTGCGMSEEFMEHMYEPFTQEEQVMKPLDEGTGLGLPIVKKTCDMMGIDIHATSTLKVGTTFTLHGIYEIAEQEYTTTKEILEYDESILKDKKILVCEDHPLNQEIIKRLLQEKGMIVTVANDGEIGVEIFKDSPLYEFSAILMDIRMPNMNGIEATKVIRKLNREDAKDVPILALTANAYEEDVEKCLNAGMNAHLSKPVIPNLLFQALSRYLKS